MNSHTQVIAQTFMLALSFGTQLFGPVVNTRLTGVGFYKLGISIVLASLVFAFGLDFFMQPGLTNLEFGCYAILIVTNVVGYIAHRDEKTWPMWLLYTVQVMVFILLIFISQHGQNEFNPSRVQFFFMTALLLGISNYAMILGHYYLVVPKLSEEPLIYTLYIFWISLFIKLTFSLTTLVWMAPTYLQEGATAGDGYMYNWLFVSMRYLWGYLAPLVLSFFTFKLCKLRSLQSATGVLYIVEFFVIVGELISIYLVSQHGLIL